jgi:deoxyribonuclease-4
MHPRLLLLGAHVSINGGFHQSIHTCSRIRGNCLAMFTGNQRTWRPQPITIPQEEIQLFKLACQQHDIDPRTQILPHASYLLNLGSGESDKLAKSRQLLQLEVAKCEQLGIGMYNFHPGSHLHKIPESDCIQRVSESINVQHQISKNVILVIENTAGQGTNIGHRFEHLAQIIENVEDKTRVGVCIDTCHTFAAGYDLRTRENCDETFSQFDEIVGINYLKAFHINDSKSEKGSRKDRHENIGEGYIGLECFRYLVNDLRFRNIPMILETPNSKAMEEIELLKSLVENNNL